VALLGALALPARAAEVSVTVRNDAAPKVWFVSPSDGDRLTAGEQVAVRVRSEGGTELEMTVNGTPAWSVTSATIDGSWTPDEGRYRMVAVVSAPGRPDGVASIDVTGVAATPAGATPPASAPGAPAGPVDPGTTTLDPGPAATPVTPEVRHRVVPSPPVGGGAVPGPVTEPSTGGGTLAPGVPTPEARAHHRSGGIGSRIAGRIAAILRDPEKVAWGAALPVLLMLMGAGYLLLQRFIDGGQKLAWRGRGRPDDSIVEF
jgi:hypothetical protein